MKSACEIATGRLELSEPPRRLTGKQKDLLRGIESECDAKIAERRIFPESEIAKSSGAPLVADSLGKQLASESASIEKKRVRRKEDIRRG